MQIRPIGKSFIIHIDRNIKTDTGLEYDGGRPETGVIIAVGAEVLELKAGDTVMFRKYMLSTEPVTIDDKEVYFGEDYRKAIVAVIDDKTDIDKDIDILFTEGMGKGIESGKQAVKNLIFKHFYSNEKN